MTIWASTRCKGQRSVVSYQLSVKALLAAVLLAVGAGFSVRVLAAQTSSSSSSSPSSSSGTVHSKKLGLDLPLVLHATSTMNVASEMGGAFMSGSKCDADGNLYVRKFAVDRPLLGPVVKIDGEGKRTALFDAAAFSKLALDRADAFSPAADGGLYQIAQGRALKSRMYVLHFSSDGSASSSTLLDADFEVYTFAAFVDGNFLVSGVKRDLQNKDDRGRNFTAVFSADGRELAQLSFGPEKGSEKAEGKRGAGGHQAEEASAGGAMGAGKNDEKAPMLDLAEAEAGVDGNIYVMRGSSPAVVYVIAPSGKIVKTMKVSSPMADGVPSAFHVSGNRLAVLFWKEDGQGLTVVVADAQTGRKIASYSDSTGLGTSFACFDANAGVFTFLELGEKNELEVVRAEAQ